MMSDPYRHVRAGDPIAIRSQTWNQILDVVRSYRPGVSKTTDAADDQSAGALTALVRNETGGTLPSRGIVAVSSPAISATSYPHDLQAQPALIATVPGDASDVVGVCLEPIPDGRYGRVSLVGVAVCDVLIADADHDYAEPVPGETGHLASVTSGPVRILWVADPATPPATPDVRRAVVLLGTWGPSGDGSVFFGRLTGYSSGRYSWRERIFDSNGNETNGPRSGTNNARPLPYWSGKDLTKTGSPTTESQGTVAVIWQDADGDGYIFLPVVSAQFPNPEVPSATLPGYVSTDAQTFAGDKTFRADYMRVLAVAGTPAVTTHTTPTAWATAVPFLPPGAQPYRTTSIEYIENAIQTDAGIVFSRVLGGGPSVPYALMAAQSEVIQLRTNDLMIRQIYGNDYNVDMIRLGHVMDSDLRTGRPYPRISIAGDDGFFADPSKITLGGNLACQITRRRARYVGEVAYGAGTRPIAASYGIDNESDDIPLGVTSPLTIYMPSVGDNVGPNRDRLFTAAPGGLFMRAGSDDGESFQIWFTARGVGVTEGYTALILIYENGTTNKIFEVAHNGNVYARGTLTADGGINGVIDGGTF